LIDLIKWTSGVTDAVLNEEKNPKNGVKAFEAFMKEMITRMVAIVRKDLNILERTLMGALIVLDVHARDVVSELV
jgi:dynein heavy chain